MAQVAEHLTSLYMVLDSIPSTAGGGDKKEVRKSGLCLEGFFV
jgi:hypothetical protein